MRDKLIWALSIHLSIFLHYTLFANCAGEAQAQNVRMNKYQVIKALAFGRRAGVAVGTYQEQLTRPPLNGTYEHRVEFAHLIEKHLRALASELHDHVQAQGDGTTLFKYSDALLIVDRGPDSDPTILDRYFYVRPYGHIELCTERAGKSTVHQTLEVNEELTYPLFQAQTISYLEKLPTKADAPLDPHGLFLDYRGATSPQLHKGVSAEEDELIDCVNKIEEQITKVAMVPSH